MHQILIIEDDDNIRGMLEYALKTAGFDPLGFADGSPLFTRLKICTPALILLDIMLPGEDGISILRKMKSSDATRQIPVIMLTAKGSEYDRIKGLDLGADDYITKPFSVIEVISRIRSVLRRCGEQTKTPTEFKVGGIVLNTDRRTVFLNDIELTLTFKEFELLHYLMLNEGIVLTRDRLLEQVWGFNYAGESRTVDMHIKTLRKKLGNAGQIINTIRNVGYKIRG